MNAISFLKNTFTRLTVDRRMEIVAEAVAREEEIEAAIMAYDPSLCFENGQGVWVDATILDADEYPELHALAEGAYRSAVYGRVLQTSWLISEDYQSAVQYDALIQFDGFMRRVPMGCFVAAVEA